MLCLSPVETEAPPRGGRPRGLWARGATSTHEEGSLDLQKRSSAELPLLGAEPGAPDPSRSRGGGRL